MKLITSGLTSLSSAHVVQSSRWVSNSTTVSRLRRWDNTRLAPARSACRLPVEMTCHPSGIGVPCKVRAWQMLARTFCKSALAWLRSSNNKMPRSGALPLTGNQSGSLYSSPLPSLGNKIPKSSTSMVGMCRSITGMSSSLATSCTMVVLPPPGLPSIQSVRWMGNVDLMVSLSSEARMSVSFVKFMVNAVCHEVHTSFLCQLSAVCSCCLLVSKVHRLFVIIADKLSTAISKGE